MLLTTLTQAQSETLSLRTIISAVRRFHTIPKIYSLALWLGRQVHCTSMQPSCFENAQLEAHSPRLGIDSANIQRLNCNSLQVGHSSGLLSILAQPKKQQQQQDGSMGAYLRSRRSSACVKSWQHHAHSVPQGKGKSCCKFMPAIHVKLPCAGDLR